MCRWKAAREAWAQDQMSLPSRPMTAQKENKGKVQDVDRKRNICTCAACVCACVCGLKG